MKELWNANALPQMSTLSEQLYHLWLLTERERSAGVDWVFSYADLGAFVGISHQHARKLILTWKKGLESGGFQDKGRPETLNKEQYNQILQYVKDCDAKMIPLTQVALLEWVNLTFSTDFSPPWLSSYIQSQESLNIVDGEPLEEV